MIHLISISERPFSITSKEFCMDFSKWAFREILNNFNFIDFHKKFKTLLSTIGKIYIVCVLQNKLPDHASIAQ